MFKSTGRPSCCGCLWLAAVLAAALSVAAPASAEARRYQPPGLNRFTDAVNAGDSVWGWPDAAARSRRRCVA